MNHSDCMSFWKCCFMQDIKIWWTLHSMDIIIIYYIAHQSVKRQWACFYFIRAALFKLVTSQSCMKTRSLYFVFKMHSFNRVRVFAQFGGVFCLPIVVRIGRVSWWFGEAMINPPYEQWVLIFLGDLGFF